MTHEEFETIAKEYGFERVFFLPPERVDLGGNRYRLIDDPLAAFPYAASIACLVYPYAPFTAEERIPAYYLASNAAYFGMKAFLTKLNGLGVRAEKAEIPLKQALDRAGIGAPLKNSLRSIAPYGSRTVLLSIAVEGLAPQIYDKREASPCAVCHACEAACPAHAIGESGLELSKCMRPRMETACHGDDIRDRQKTYIGCELCQYACPMNAKLGRSAPTEAQRTAFDLLALIRGEAKSARLLVGKNMTSNGRLTAEAIAFAARDELLPKAELEAELAAAEGSQFPAVRDAVRYAREKLLKSTQKFD